MAMDDLLIPGCYCDNQGDDTQRTGDGFTLLTWCAECKGHTRYIAGTARELIPFLEALAAAEDDGNERRGG